MEDDGPQLGPAHLDPSDFIQTIDNPYFFPARAGDEVGVQGDQLEGDERIVVTVLDRTKVVDGVTARVVRDEVTEVGGKLIEDTHDWWVWASSRSTTSRAATRRSSSRG